MFARSRRRALLTSAAVAAAVALAGCADGAKNVETIPTPPKETINAEDIVRFDREPVVVLEADIQQSLGLGFDRGEPLPAYQVGPVVVRDMPAYEVLKIIAAPYDVAVVPAPGLATRRVSLIDPVKRPMGEAIELIARQAGLFYHYADGVLQIDDERSFSVRVPDMPFMSAKQESADDEEEDGGMSPSVVETATGLTPYRILNEAYLADTGDEEGADSSNDRAPEQPGSLRDAFARTFVDLGAREAVVDGHSDVVNFTADYPTYRRIAQYMSDFEHSRDVIVYDTWVYEVALQKGQDVGINWSSLTTRDGVELQFGAINNTSASAGTSAPTPGSGSSESEGGSGESSLSDVAQAIGASAGLADGLALGVVGEAGTSVIAGLLSFLESHGTTRALAKPTISLSSGRHALYHVGETLEYISKVEVNSSENDDGDNQNNTGVDTKQIETGVKMVLGGSYTNGVVSSKLFLDLVELIRFNTFDTGSVKLQLPQTSQRRLHTEFEARPGDLIVIGGLIRDTGDTSQTLIPGTETAIGNASAHKRTELVIMMRPRLIKIRPENWTENDRVGGRVDQEPGAVLDAVKRGAKKTDVIPKDLLLESLRDGEASR
ncbi:hypothetical protein CKO28_09090 [Rhodovibrio sodomensis]|uniref:Type II/III secretion system secretin-like domain-containing protein n=1 Tax=Rhodovibrio sodomensis TaxID=1088 RepID=A0ABS1DCK4_9PROT|nr:hypothetical protein [Rhodovibrio sodomensis]MBK1668191.1 hypothetical protein [Rhodovibrio sodomensis]